MKSGPVVERVSGTRAQIFGVTEIVRYALREVLEKYTLPLEHCNGRVEVEPLELERVLLAHVMDRIEVVS